MKKTIASVVLVIIFLVLTLAITPAATADEPEGSSPNKIESLLALQVNMKLRQIETGEPVLQSLEGLLSSSFALQSTDPVVLQNQRVFLYFEEKPTSEQIAELAALGVTAYPDSWIPPLENHPAGFILADMPVDKLDEVAEIGAVVSMSTAEVEFELQNDLAAVATNVDDVWGGGYDGTGVTIAVLDSGFEIDNPDFPSMIAGTDYKDYGYYPTLDNTVANTVTGHGTHVAGTALGRGTASTSGVYKGVAYEATPVFLKVGKDDGSITADAITYAMRDAVDVYNADVITLSLGTRIDYLDGSSASSQAVDYAVSQGAVVFVSAGNSGSGGDHIAGTAYASGWSGWIQVTLSADNYLYYNMIWDDGLGTNNDLELHYYSSLGGSELSSITTGGQSESSRGTEGELSYYGSPSTISAGTYYLRVKNNSASDQLFHLYSVVTDNIAFASPDPNYTIGDPAVADGAIAVGSYTTRKYWWDYSNAPDATGWSFASGETVGQIATSSSRGPRIDGADKPNIVAPGSAIISCRDDDVYPWGSAGAFYIDNDGPNVYNASVNNPISGAQARYYVMAGTSMAAPHAAGVAALLLEAHPTWTPDQVRHALESTASDKGGGGWDSTYGWGLVDALAANGTSVPTIVSCDSGGTESNSFTPGETVYVKGSGLEASTSYKIWIQDNEVTESKTLATGEDDSGTQETVSTDGSGNLAVTAIWAIPGGASVTNDAFDIVVDKQSDGGNTGIYNAASDGLDGISAVGFTAPVPEFPTIVLVGLGVTCLGGFLWVTRRRRRVILAN